MKKVILYSSSQLEKIKETGGIKRFKELARNLSKYCELTVVSGDEQLSFLGQANHISMHHNKMGRKELDYAVRNIKYLLKLKKMNYDSLISFDVPPTVWLVLLGMPHICLMVRKDLIGYERIIQGKNGIKSFLKLKALSIAELITILKAERIIVQCEYDKCVLLSRHRLFNSKIEKKIKVQINNVNPSWTGQNDVPFDRPFREDSTFVIGSINGFGDLRKGCDLFLKAAYNLVESGENIIAYIAGDGYLIEKYKKIYNTCDRIVFLGRIDNPNSFLKRLDLSIVPSRADSCPNTIMESLNNKVPVIASKSGGIPEILPFEEALFDLDVDSMEERIRELIHNKNNLIELYEKESIRKKELEFDWSHEIFNRIFEE